MTQRPPNIIVSEVTDPEALAQARVRDEQFARNLAWFEPRAAEIYAAHRGKHICVAGGELFVADSTAEALSRAREAHPEDEGRFILDIPREPMEQVHFTLPPGRWKAFCQALDAPPRVIPSLRKLLTEASVFADRQTPGGK